MNLNGKQDEQRLMKQLLTIFFGLALFVSTVSAQAVKEFPLHWGKPPEIQTRDYVELPGGYGHGSSTLAKWIASNLEKDNTAALPSTPALTLPLYANDFEKAETGELPDDFLALVGEFAVQQDSTNKVLELPGAPLDSFAVLFGPTTNQNVSVTASILGTSRGRLYPAFGVGLCGVSGYRLQVTPGKGALEIYRDTDLKSAVPYEWKPATWTRMRFQVRKVRDGEWQVEGKAWAAGDAEPSVWQVEFATTETPIAGRASVTGSPFSGKPIWFDDLIVEQLSGSQAQSKSEQLMK